jgi:ankyrin repeat protein
MRDKWSKHILWATAALALLSVAIAVWVCRSAPIRSGDIYSMIDIWAVSEEFENLDRCIDRNYASFDEVVYLCVANSRVEAVNYLLQSPKYKLNRSAELDLLHMSASLAQPNVTELLLKRGLNPNYRTKSGGTPLVRAAGYMGLGCKILAPRQHRTVELLLQYGADPNFTSSNGYYALGEAVGAGNTNLIPLLIENGASTNVLDPDVKLPVLQKLIIDRAATRRFIQVYLESQTAPR